MNRSFQISVATSLLVLCLAAPVAAQQKPNAAEAEQEYNVGKRAEELGNLRLAAIHYKRAYDLYPTPTLLYTLAHTHRLLGDREIALDYYKRYVAADPGGPRVNAANKYIKILSEAIGVDDAVEPPDDDGGDGGGDDGGGDPGSDKNPSDGAPAPGLDPGPRDPGAPGHTLRWVGVGVGVVGLAGLATGIAFGVKAQSLADEVNNPGMSWEQEELDKFAEGEDAERNQIIFTAAGGALLVTGVVLVVIDSLDGDGGGDVAAVAPVLGPERVGLAVSGRF